MQNLFQRALLPRAAGGLLLIIAGALGFALAAPDSWRALASLVAHLAGLALLFAATHIWMERFGGRARMAAGAGRRPAQGCGIALLRVALIAAMVVAAGFWLWNAVLDLNEMRLLVFGGRRATAQIVTKEIVRANDPVGYIGYSYRVSPTVSPVGRFAVPHSEYPRYRVMQSLEVTYAAADPTVHRIGPVDWIYALRRLIYWFLLLANGAAYLYLPLWLLEFRRQPDVGNGGAR